MVKSQPSGAIRCAIYTRKSTEDGLDQAFNSLDAQREACEAYVASQRHEGWVLVPDRYDDGGISGGTMDRPGLKRLLADVEAGKVTSIVVYKVDRLTRSLADFAKIVEILDKRSASFVSITQAFNTTTSMGRLTLNVLLSFAQFEREVTGERIRDKVAASKAKGMWMGGNPPLGYEVKDRKLVVIDAEAQTVRHIFQRYAELGNGRLLMRELDQSGIRTKQYRTRGGVAFTRGGLFHLLSNRIYLGEMVHKGVGYPGEHDAIVGQDLWNAAQSKLADNRVTRQTKTNVRDPSLLAGRLTDGEGRRMSPSHASKAGKRYRYYTTPPSELVDNKSAWSIPAHDLEAAVLQRIDACLIDRVMILNTLGASADAATLASAISRGRAVAQALTQSATRYATLRELVRSIQLHLDRVDIEIDRQALLQRFGIACETEETIAVQASIVRIRRGKDVRLVIRNDEGRSASAPDTTIVALLREAQASWQAMQDRPALSLKQVAAQMKCCRTRFAKLVRLSMIAPDIVQRCIDGTQPATLTSRQLLETDLPIAWADQRIALGF